MTFDIIDTILSAVEKDRLIAFARRLIGIRSVTTDPRPEDEIAHVVEAEWKAIGLETRLQEFRPGRFNVYGLLKGTRPGPRLALQAHMDTGHPSVLCKFDPFAAVVQDGWLYGCGSMNMKQALAANTEAIRALLFSKAPFAGEVALVAVGGEGSGCIGSRAAMDSGFRADMCVIGEPTENIVLTAHTGAVQLEITTHGVQRHTSTIPQVGYSGDAIGSMRNLLNELRWPLRVFRYQRPSVLGGPLVCVGSIRGGKEGRPAWFAEECRCEIDIRTVPGMTVESVTVDLEAIFAKIKKRDPSFNAEIKVWDQSKNLLPAAVDRKAPVVQLAREAFRRATGAAPKVGSPIPMRYYFTDACCWTNFGKVPTVNFGCGSLRESTPEERVQIADLVAMTKAYAIMPTLVAAKSRG